MAVTIWSIEIDPNSEEEAFESPELTDAIVQIERKPAAYSSPSTHAARLVTPTRSRVPRRRLRVRRAG